MWCESLCALHHWWQGAGSPTGWPFVLPTVEVLVLQLQSSKASLNKLSCLRRLWMAFLFIFSPPNIAPQVWVRLLTFLIPVFLATSCFKVVSHPSSTITLLTGIRTGETSGHFSPYYHLVSPGGAGLADLCGLCGAGTMGSGVSLIQEWELINTLCPADNFYWSSVS